MENIVALELMRKRSLDPRNEIYYWKDHQQKEVDFVIKIGDKIEECIQVTYAKNKTDIDKRETSSLTKASKKLRCDNLTVITWDYQHDRGGIKYIPLWKWLLEQ